MIEIKTTTNVALISKALRVLGERQIPFVLALAATKTGQLVKARLLKEIPNVIDRPTPQTMRGLFLKGATKKRPEARVWFKDSFSAGIPADRYLRPQVEGGSRRPKRMEVALRKRGILAGDEWAVPSRDILNQFGNMPGSLATKILSGLGAAETSSGVTANASSSKRSKRKGNATRYFVAKIGGARGIWERKKSAFGVGVRPVVLFAKKAPAYKVRFEFFEIANEVVRDEYARVFLAAIDQAVKSARPRG